MNSLFIRVGNEIINREQVCSVERHGIDPEDAKLLGAYAIVYVRTADGRELRFKDQEAEVVWEVFESSALAIRD